MELNANITVSLNKEFGKLNEKQIDGVFEIIKGFAYSDLRWLAYILATAWHETDHTMQPIREYGRGKGKPYGTNLKEDRKTRYYDTTNIFYGRGYVQLTWYDNYQKAGRLLNIDLIHNPDLALQPDIAAKIILVGMTRGWFTGKKLSSYFNEEKTDWVEARRIINRLDKAELISDYAQKFYKCLIDG